MLSLDTDTPVEADKLDPAALKPLWHLMEQEVWDSDYRRQVLF